MTTTQEDRAKFFEDWTAKGYEVWILKETAPDVMEPDRRITRVEDVPAEGLVVVINWEAWKITPSEFPTI